MKTCRVAHEHNLKSLTRRRSCQCDSRSIPEKKSPPSPLDLSMNFCRSFDHPNHLRGWRIRLSGWQRQSKHTCFRFLFDHLSTARSAHTPRSVHTNVCNLSTRRVGKKRNYTPRRRCEIDIAVDCCFCVRSHCYCQANFYDYKHRQVLFPPRVIPII